MVRFSENSCIREETDYTIYWSGKTLTERSESGVDFAVRNGPLPSMNEDLKLVLDRLITLGFPFNHSKSYDTLDQIHRTIPNVGKIVFLGNFKVRFG